ncbi:rho GTPase-activating protein 30 isoform X1 [Mixophyes fleayi]|uniref:rho GTPase-activating protein 30 isoform X1 n=1 Tax=Mixophyes fleayi TaxID=3061075 RepID=UPI003F4DF3C5
MSLAMKARQKVKKKTVKDKIFGCNLMEHLQLSGQEVPQVLKSCTEFVEEHGIVDGIYRLCGIASNVQKLRQEFDMERPPDLNKSTYLQDVHCVSSLCKAYFRELPNPLLTYQLYDKFADAVAIQLEEQRLIKIREVLKELPLPHYRTLEYLMKHLVFMASFSSQTNMHARNLAIVWAPNLLRSKDIESSGFNGTAAFMEVRVQSIVVEFILTHVEQLFGVGTIPGKENDSGPSATMNWPSCVPEEYYRSLSYNLPNILNHGDGPPQIRPYHTIIEFSDNKRKGSIKAKKWKSIFNLGRSSHDSKRKSHKQDDKDGKSDNMNLRPAKSMDSLSSVPYTPDAGDLEQSVLTRRSPKNQLPIRRESFGAQSKPENIDYLFLDSGEPSIRMETNDAEYEEEAQAKSEPTTPKAGRSSHIGNPQGRSPKSNQNRAEKCVGVHISGPFSVTLPFHITSNLSRLTRGMEIPSLNYSALHRSSEKLFLQEANRESTESSTDNVKSSLVFDNESTNTFETSITEDSDPKVENNQILFDVQDSFSFLDNQDPSPENNDICQSEETSHKIADYSVDSEILEYELQTAIQMEEFSVEPPPDDLCTEDESEQMYFMPTGCLDAKHQWRESHDSLEDVYLSAYDDLSPLPLESVEMKLDEVTKVHRESEDISMNTENQGTEKYCILNESLPTNTESHDNELQLCGHQLDIDTMETTMDGSHNIMPEAEVHYSQHCNLEDKAAIENVAYIEESECCMVKDQKVHDNNPDNKAYAANPGSIQLQNTGDLSSNDDKLEDQTTMESPGPIELQKGKSYSKDEKPEDEAIKECPGPIELQDGGTYSKDQDPEDGVIMESPGPIELQIGGSYSKDEKPEDEAIQECPGPIELQDGGTYSKDQDPEDGVIMESPGPIELQIGGSYSKDEKPEDEAIKECRGPIELQDGGTYIKHNNLEDKANVEIADPIEVDDGRIYSKDETPEDGTIMESPGPIEIPDGGSYNQHLEDEATVDGPSPEELQDSGLGSKCKSLGHQVAIKNLGSVEFQDHEHYNLVDAGKEIDCRTSQDGGAHAQNLNILADKTTLDSADYKDNSLTNIHIYHCDDHDLQQTVDNIINMSVNSLSGVDDAARIFSSPSQVETAEEHHWANEEHWEELKSISGNQLCFKEDSQTSDPCSSAEGYGLSERINLIPLSKDHFIQQDGSTESKPQEFNQTCSPEELRLSNVTKSSELDDTEISGTYYDGSVTMKLTSTTSKIQQTKSVPVVPPKPQFAKLPPALKSKVHVSSLSTKPQKSGMSSRVEPAESGNDSIPKRRTSWRNATSVSFDTAMALAKERQQSQNPVRRMQTYCIGDSYDVLDSSKIDHTPHVQKFTIKSANNRTNRPYSCLSITSSEAELRGKNLVRDEPNALTIHGSQPILSRGPDVYTQELPHRNRLSMPRLGRQSSGDDLTDLCLQQRRSLL